MTTTTSSWFSVTSPAVTATSTGFTTSSTEVTSETKTASFGTMYVEPGSNDASLVSGKGFASPGSASFRTTPTTLPRGNTNSRSVCASPPSSSAFTTSVAGSVTTIGVACSATASNESRVTSRSSKKLVLSSGEAGDSPSSEIPSRDQTAAAGASTSANVNVERQVTESSPPGGKSSHWIPHAFGTTTGKSGLLAKNRELPRGAHKHPRARAARSVAQHSVTTNVETSLSTRKSAHAVDAYITYVSHVAHSYARMVSPFRHELTIASSDVCSVVPGDSGIEIGTDGGTDPTISIPHSFGTRDCSSLAGGARKRHASLNSVTTPATGRTDGTCPGIDVNASGNSKTSSKTLGQLPVNANPHPNGANPTKRLKKVSELLPEPRKVSEIGKTKCQSRNVACVITGGQSANSRGIWERPNTYLRRTNTLTR